MEGALLASCLALGDVGSVFESGEPERRFRHRDEINS